MDPTCPGCGLIFKKIKDLILNHPDNIAVIVRFNLVSSAGKSSDKNIQFVSLLLSLQEQKCIIRAIDSWYSKRGLKNFEQWRSEHGCVSQVRNKIINLNKKPLNGSNH